MPARLAGSRRIAGGKGWLAVSNKLLRFFLMRRVAPPLAKLRRSFQIPSIITQRRSAILLQ